MLKDNNVAIKYTQQKGLKGDNSPTAQPVHKDDADHNEADGGGKEIGSRYAVWYCGKLITDRWITCFVTACYDDVVSVVAVKHHTLRKVTLPETTDGADVYFFCCVFCC